MKYEEIVIDNQDSFELKDIFECGQCFRWKEETNGSYTGVVKIGLLNVNKEKNKSIIVKGFIHENEDLKSFCESYFDLNTDYKKIQKEISKNDDIMKEAIKYGKGIRILNQDSFEMLISFIISAANNIPRISKCIENISKKYGEKIEIPEKIFKKMYDFCNKNDREYCLFPSPEALAKAKVEDLRDCNLGFRDKYVLNASKLVVKREVDLNIIQKLKYSDAKKQLTAISGVGAKVADCILLFSMEKKEAFPVDTWIKKIMNEVYIDSINVKKINEYASQKWGKNAGIAQQYLFYFKRNS